MKKLVTFEQFAAEKAKETQVQLEQELNTKREAAANSFKELLSEFGVASIGELSEEDRLKFNEKLGTLTESALLLEGTRGQFGIIDKNGNIQSVYTHYDSYPENVLPLIKKYYKKSKDVNGVIAKGGNSGLDAPDKIKFYGDDRDPMTGKKSNIDNYLKKANDDGGAEYVYLYDEADKKWYMADIYGETGLVPAFESVVTEGKKVKVTKKDIEDIEDSGNIDIAYKKAMKILTSLVESVVTEGKDDFMARYGSANINLKKGYKHHTEEELNDLYDKLGDLVKTLKVKDVTLVFESEVSERINDFGGPGLIVVGKSKKDNDLIDQATEESGFYGIYNKKENYWFFPEEGDQATIDKLENELETIFMKKGANVRYEAQYESVVNEAEINTDEEFKEYAFTVLKKAFGEDFDEAKAQEVVDGILGKVDGDYGKAAGILQSSLG
jgi:hypothetical protein